MASIVSTFLGWLGWGSGAMGDRSGRQITAPSASVSSVRGPVSADTALQLDTVWSCVDRRATTVASLPLFVYERMSGGQKNLARTTRLYGLLHDSPNARMTPFDFWRAMLLNLDLRGNAYARIDRDDRGEAIALWPMAAEQVEAEVLGDGSMVYLYRIGSDVAVLAEANVLHLRGVGNGTVGMDKLAFMRAGLGEAVAQVESASTVWGTSGKPTGMLMLDRVLSDEQRAKLQARFAEMAQGNASRLYVLEASMKYAAVSITPEQQQLLESRRFSVEQICRWYDVPPVLVHHANVTTWGSGIEQIVDGYYKLTIRPLLVAIEQALTKRVLTPAQRARHGIEFSLDALLRGNAQDRANLYASGLQNGWISRNEVRQLENLPPRAGADDLTAQSQLVPIQQLGTTQTTTGGTNAPA